MITTAELGSLQVSQPKLRDCTCPEGHSCYKEETCPEVHQYVVMGNTEEPAGSLQEYVLYGLL